MADISKPLIFQIGFNKCATSALFLLFQKSGYKSLHSGGRFWRRKQHPLITQNSPQVEIAANIAAGKDPLGALIEFDAFFDMEFARHWPWIENYKNFESFAATYSNARFILNTRDEARWLESRMRHWDGKYAANAMAGLGLDQDGLRALWRDDYRRHNDRVRQYFRDMPDRLVEFNIDSDDISKLIDFAAPGFSLNPEFWKTVRKTDRIAKKRNWSR